MSRGVTGITSLPRSFDSVRVGSPGLPSKGSPLFLLMENILKSTYQYKPAPGTTMARRQTDWKKLSNENLKFALDLLSLHQSPWEVEAANEIMRRIEEGTWLDLDAPPPPLENLPKWLKTWPFCLLWSQRPR